MAGASQFASVGRAEKGSGRVVFPSLIKPFTRKKCDVVICFSVDRQLAEYLSQYGRKFEAMPG